MSNKVRVIVNGVSFYTTQAQIKRGVGSDMTINYYVHSALKQCIREGIKGLGRTYHSYGPEGSPTPLNLQIDL